MTKAAKTVHIIGILIAAATAQVFLVLSLAYVRESWGVWYYVALVSGSVLNAALFATDLTFYFLRRAIVYKSCIIAYLLTAVALAVVYLLIATGFFRIAGDEELLKEYLSHTGGYMAAIFVLLQFLQVVILPIPSTVTVIAGAALFGALIGSLLSLLGIVLGSLCAFFIGRYAGLRAVAWLVGKDTLDKWLKKIEGKDKLLLSAMFLLPAFPDDVLCFVAGLSSMSVWLFLGVILVSRVLAVFTTSYSVELIPLDRWWGILIWCVLAVSFVVFLIVLYKKSDAILAWFEKKFHRETRVREKRGKGEFTLQIVGPDGAIIEKGVKRGEESGKEADRTKEADGEKKNKTS